LRSFGVEKNFFYELFIARRKEKDFFKRENKVFKMKNARDDENDDEKWKLLRKKNFRL
jgi:hypothetical protein